ncbi:MAG: hypothetical protein Nkreftii_000391 [Candidatus Nitrospira kreftii]|uniref:Uncharacterized protein n=1 Tax=Candidatus Nitrospira kreftii TaxID=2652173 RepID=A0A7S8FBB5_9BACT|nr:MAG: hypothetical protein Nkreftii_000391 [Candidatus Nitrospira kreftii]
MTKTEREQIIFRLFAEAARLLVVSGSIRSQSPPAPDIFCEIQNRGKVAFELVEIVTPAFVKGMEDGQKLRKAFETDCKRYPEIADKFSDAHIYVGFFEDVLFPQRHQSVPIVVDELHKQSRTSVEYIPVPPTLRKVVREISVTRGVRDGPAFDVMEMTEHTEEIFGQIEKKCKKNYSKNHPIELLAYYISQPSSDSFDWQSEFHSYVLEALPRCPFERVWVFDNWSTEKIKYVYPSLNEGIEK